MPGLDVLYNTYSFQIIPPLGKKVWKVDLFSSEKMLFLGQVIAGDWNSYQYLVESIQQFPDQVQLPVCWFFRFH